MRAAGDWRSRDGATRSELPAEAAPSRAAASGS